jgi:hypothetical protein
MNSQNINSAGTVGATTVTTSYLSGAQVTGQLNLLGNGITGGGTIDAITVNTIYLSGVFMNGTLNMNSQNINSAGTISGASLSVSGNINTTSGKIQEGTNEYVSLNQLKQYIETIQNEKIMKQTFIGKQSNLLDLFYSYSKNLDFIDLLIQFGVSGIYAFCVKSDCEGFYSVGNSYDICELLSVIKPFLLKNKDNLDSEENWLYMWIDELTDVFKSSIENKVIVTIC